MSDDAAVKPAKPTRDQREVLRLSVAERAAIKRFADVYGLAPSTYVRQAALGQLPPVPITTTPIAVERERIEAEVAEAKLEDDPARDAFIERRARELYGQGKTTLVAKTLAAQEWEGRGA